MIATNIALSLFNLALVALLWIGMVRPATKQREAAKRHFELMEKQQFVELLVRTGAFSTSQKAVYIKQLSREGYEAERI